MLHPKKNITNNNIVTKRIKKNIDLTPINSTQLRPFINTFLKQTPTIAVSMTLLYSGKILSASR